MYNPTPTTGSDKQDPDICIVAGAGDSGQALADNFLKNIQDLCKKKEAASVHLEPSVLVSTKMTTLCRCESADLRFGYC